MINMIKAELYRMTKTKGFYLFWGVMLISYLITIIYKQEGGISLGAPIVTDNSLKMDVRMVSWNFTYYYLFIIPVFTTVCSEFSNHTYKNTISSAISRKTYYFSKYFFILVYTLLSFSLLNFAFYAANRLVNGSEYSSSLGRFAKSVAVQLPVMAAIISLFIFIAFAVKKGAVFNSVTIISPILYTTLGLVLYGIKDTKAFAEKMLTCEISTIIMRVAKETSGSFTAKCMAGSALVIILSALFGYVIFTKREID